MTDTPVRTSVKNRTGVILLDRPRALNSLNAEMVGIIEPVLDAWRDDPTIEQVLIQSSSEKGFCAGGDVRAAREGMLNGREEEVDAFFRREYRMDLTIGTYPKPVVSLIDGVVMGGGLGIAANGTHRVFSERAFASMPEMAIGFVTDVGMSRVLQNLTHSRAMGLFLAVTGWRLNPTEALRTGVATHMVRAARFPELAEAIVHRGVEAALLEFAEEPDRGDDRLRPLEREIDRVFDAPTWPEIARRLEESDNAEFTGICGKLLASASPSSLVATALLFEATGRARCLEDALLLEQRLGETIRRQPDFAEGVRAVLVDKTKDARFTPASVAAVDDSPYREALGLTA